MHYTFIFISCYCLSFLALFLVRLVVKCICFPSSSPPSAHSGVVTDSCQFHQRSLDRREGLTSWSQPDWKPPFLVTITMILDNVLNLSKTMFSNSTYFWEFFWRIIEKRYMKYLRQCLVDSRCSRKVATYSLQKTGSPHSQVQYAVSGSQGKWM